MARSFNVTVRGKSSRVEYEPDDSSSSPATGTQVIFLRPSAKSIFSAEIFPMIASRLATQPESTRDAQEVLSDIESILPNVQLFT